MPCFLVPVLQEGPFALYKGWLPSVIGVIPYVGLNFAVYESLKASLLQVGVLRGVLHAMYHAPMRASVRDAELCGHDAPEARAPLWVHP